MNVQDLTAELIEVGRREEVLDGARLEQNRSRILARTLALGVAGAGLAVSSSVASASTGGAGLSVAGKSLAAWSLGKLTAVAAVVAVSGAGTYAVVTQSQPAAVVRPAEPAKVHEAARRAPVAPPPAQPDRALAPEATPSEPAPRPSTPLAGSTPGKPHAAASSLSNHAELLREARTALAAGNAGKALSVLDAHPEAARGPLGPEWSAARVLVLCRLGRTGEAKQLGQRFLKSHPSSPLAAQVAASCAGPGD